MSSMVSQAMAIYQKLNHPSIQSSQLEDKSDGEDPGEYFSDPEDNPANKK